MWYLYLDESGDLGFDFVNKKPSKFFTITVLAISGNENNRHIINGVNKTIKRKLNPKNRRKRFSSELKGTNTTLEIKDYFYQQVNPIQFGLYSMTLNKRRVYDELAENKARVYNFIARKVMDRIPFEKNDGDGIYLYVDKSKSKPEIIDFNQYIETQLQGRLNPKTLLKIVHDNSQCNRGLQAVDLFAYGIFQKYERKNEAWLDIYREKVIYEEQYL